MYKIPNQNNLYGTILNVKSKKILADMFAARGWRVRKSTWTDFEVRTNWSELTIENEDHIPLINGVIDPTMFDDLRQLLNSFGVGYSIELYDNERTLIKKETSEN